MRGIENKGRKIRQKSFVDMFRLAMLGAWFTRETEFSERLIEDIKFCSERLDLITRYPTETMAYKIMGKIAGIL